MIIGYYEIVTTEGTFFCDRYESDTIKQAEAEAKATFKNVIKVIEH